MRVCAHVLDPNLIRKLTIARFCQRHRAIRVPQPKRSYNLANWPERERKGWYGFVTVFSNLYSARSMVLNAQSSIACALEQHLLHQHKFSYRLDGDNVRFGLNRDLGFDEKSRVENIRRIGEVRRPDKHRLIQSDRWNIYQGFKVIRRRRLHYDYCIYISLLCRPGNSSRTPSKG